MWHPLPLPKQEIKMMLVTAGKSFSFRVNQFYCVCVCVCVFVCVFIII